MTDPRRRIDRVTSTEFLHRLEHREADEVRQMRDDCRAEEPALSYSRRVLQGQIDIVRAEQTRRREGGDLVEHLTRALADKPAANPQPHHVTTVFVPDDDSYGSRDHDAHVDDSAIGRVSELDDDELSQLAERLVAREREVSDLRRAVLDHLDALQDEMVRRYRTGATSVEDAIHLND